MGLSTKPCAVDAVAKQSRRHTVSCGGMVLAESHVAHARQVRVLAPLEEHLQLNSVLWLRPTKSPSSFALSLPTSERTFVTCTQDAYVLPSSALAAQNSLPQPFRDAAPYVSLNLVCLLLAYENDDKWALFGVMLTCMQIGDENMLQLSHSLPAHTHA